MRLLHYSHQPIVRVRSIKQDPPDPNKGPRGKPRGFWVSVGDAWRQWCESEDWNIGALAFEHEVTLHKGANILYLRSIGDIDKFTETFKLPTELNKFAIFDLDWMTVASLYDGIIITPYQYGRRFASSTEWYYGWDCASGCIWNSKAIKSISLVSDSALTK